MTSKRVKKIDVANDSVPQITQSSLVDEADQDKAEAVSNNNYTWAIDNESLNIDLKIET